MISIRTRTIPLTIALACLFLLPGFPAHADETLTFSLGGIRVGMPVEEVTATLGIPPFKESVDLEYPEQHLRIALDFKTHRRVIDVTGERDLYFGGRALVRLGQSPGEVHSVLGHPDESKESTLSTPQTLARMEMYSRFHLTVYYRFHPERERLGVVMFTLSSPEMDTFLNQNPADKQ